jgi:hypothetical protein
MKSNKYTGIDNIPYEFYVEFWDMIALQFFYMFNHILERKKSDGIAGPSGDQASSQDFRNL